MPDITGLLKLLAIFNYHVVCFSTITDIYSLLFGTDGSFLFFYHYLRKNNKY